MIVAIVLNSTECKAPLAEVRTPYGYLCLTKEQSQQLRYRTNGR